VVEIIVKKHARCRYTTIQNWANNIYNLVTKRADGLRRFADGVDRRQPRQKLTMKYPAVYMMEAGRPRRDPVDRLRVEGPASGRRRQGRPLCAEHHEPHHLEEHQQERRPLQLPRLVKVEKGATTARATSSATR
jgi:hypothetical protein